MCQGAVRAISLRGYQSSDSAGPVIELSTYHQGIQLLTVRSALVSLSRRSFTMPTLFIPMAMSKARAFDYYHTGESSNIEKQMSGSLLLPYHV